MNTKTSHWGTAIVIAGGLFATLPSHAAQYTLIDLGVPVGHKGAIAVDINNAGGIAVTADQGATSSQAYFYSSGSFTPIPTTLLAHSMVAAGLNDSNQVVGSYLDAGGTSHGFYYDGNSHTFHNADYSSFPGNNHALAINNSGAILGAVADFGKSGGGGAGGAGGWIYSGGIAFDVDSTVGALSHVFDLNDNGRLLATNGTMAQYYVWNSTPPHSAPIDFLSMTTFATGLTVLNDNLLLAGANGTNLTLLNYALGDAAPVINAGTLGAGVTVANDINNGGWVVGDYKSVTGQQEGFLYNGSSLLAVNTLIDPSLLAAGWNLTSANGVNEAGDIVGGGLAPDGLVHAYLLTPSAVPEPGAIGLSAAAGLALLAAAKMRRRKQASP